MGEKQQAITKGSTVFVYEPTISSRIMRGFVQSIIEQNGEFVIYLPDEPRDECGQMRRTVASKGYVGTTEREALNNALFHAQSNAEYWRTRIERLLLLYEHNSERDGE